MKRRASSSGCESRPVKGEPARAGSKPGAVRGNTFGDASAGERAGRGTAAPKPLLPGCRAGWISSKAITVPGAHWARGGLYLAAGSTTAGTKRTVPSPGRPSPLLDTPRLGGEPVTRLRRTARMREYVSSASRGTGQASASREATARGTGAVTEGGRESEGGRGAVRSGNGLARWTRPSTGGPC